MSEDTRPGEEDTGHDDRPALPRHLSALIGPLRGPADLGSNHDKYLTYADREDAGGAASAWFSAIRDRWSLPSTLLTATTAAAWTSCGKTGPAWLSRRWPSPRSATCSLTRNVAGVRTGCWVLRRDRRRRVAGHRSHSLWLPSHAELLTTYASLRLQVADSCVIALAEGLTYLGAAIDWRDFLVV